MEPIEAVEYKGYKIEIHQDEDPINPREWDNLGTMLCKHPRYELGDVKQSKEMGVEDIKEYVKRKDVISLPLFLLDHSGLWMRTGRFECDSQGWDTSMVGWITVTYERALKEYDKKRMSKAFRQKIEKRLESEVRTYSDYLEGKVVGYVIKSQDGEDMDACWGFYPNQETLYIEQRYESMLSECRDLVDGWSKKDKEKENVIENVTSA